MIAPASVRPVQQYPGGEKATGFGLLLFSRRRIEPMASVEPTENTGMMS